VVVVLVGRVTAVAVEQVRCFIQALMNLQIHARSQLVLAAQPQMARQRRQTIMERQLYLELSLLPVVEQVEELVQETDSLAVQVVAALPTTPDEMDRKLLTLVLMLHILVKAAWAPVVEIKTITAVVVAVEPVVMVEMELDQVRRQVRVETVSH
jgi:folate-dependent tRNA-U54 methylase TrmFO/GidA